MSQFTNIQQHLYWLSGWDVLSLCDSIKVSKSKREKISKNEYHEWQHKLMRIISKKNNNNIMFIETKIDDHNYDNETPSEFISDWFVKLVCLLLLLFVSYKKT